MPPDQIKSFSDLEELGLEAVRNSKTNRLGYKRPNGKIVNQRRHLSASENIEIGNILFPVKRKATEHDPSLGAHSSQISTEREGEGNHTPQSVETPVS